jgi:hypothetical protein
MSPTWVYLAVAALHLPGIGLLVFLVRNLADSDPPEPAAVVPARPPGPADGWRWRPRAPRAPQRGSGSAAGRAARERMRGSASSSSMTE